MNREWVYRQNFTQLLWDELSRIGEYLNFFPHGSTASRQRVHGGRDVSLIKNKIKWKNQLLPQISMYFAHQYKWNGIHMCTLHKCICRMLKKKKMSTKQTNKQKSISSLSLPGSTDALTLCQCLYGTFTIKPMRTNRDGLRAWIVTTENQQKCVYIQLCIKYQQEHNRKIQSKFWYDLDNFLIVKNMAYTLVISYYVTFPL